MMSRMGRTLSRCTLAILFALLFWGVFGQLTIVPAIASANQDAFPRVPPDLSKVSVGDADVAGYADVTGSPGAVPANAEVAIVNLNAHNVAMATADASGGFSVSLFAPLGSSLLIKYETDGTRIQRFWQKAIAAVSDETTNNLNELPGAILRVGGTEPAQGDEQTFHIVGGFSGDELPKRWAGWYMSGSLLVRGQKGGWGLSASPGQTVYMSLEMRATSPAFSCSDPIETVMDLHVRLREVFGLEGTASASELWFDSFLFTPTGLPIEREGWVPPIAATGPHVFTNVSCVGRHVVGGDLELSFKLPPNLREGYYRLEIVFDPQIPYASDVGQAVVWQQEPSVARDTPIIRVGDPLPPRIPWLLFGDELVNGDRGATAVQDVSTYQMVNRVTTPTHIPVIPPVEERTGQPITYELAPGSSWLTNTDRRLGPPPYIPLHLPSGELSVEIEQPDGQVVHLGPSALQQSSVRTPTTAGGAEYAQGTGHLGDMYHLYNRDGDLAYAFTQQGFHVIRLRGEVQDVYGNLYAIQSDYEVVVAHVLDLDPNILPTTPFAVDDFFSPGLHLFPPKPADVHITLTHVPFSDPNQQKETELHGVANGAGYFQAAEGAGVAMDQPGEFRVDISAYYEDESGEVWFGSMTWGGVVETPDAQLVAHGRRGMDYKSDQIDDMPIWFRNQDLPASKVGIENYYPYLSGDIHWGDQNLDHGWLGDSIHSIITFEDLTPQGSFYDLVRQFYPKATNVFRWPPEDTGLTGLDKRIQIGEAPLFLASATGHLPEQYPEEIGLMSYWYGSSQRPDVRVRELISEDNMGTAYWRFDDTYNYQLGEPADGDHPGDIKWEFGGIVFRTISETNPIQQYAIYSSFWVLLPEDCDTDPFGCARVTPPFQDATGASINGGPIMTLQGQDIDMLFLPKCVRPGDILNVDETVAFCGHVGPPLDSRVDVTITAPDGSTHARSWHANKIGWLYDPSFDFDADQPGRWLVEVQVTHDRPYAGNGVTPTSHNTGTVLGTSGVYEFYVVEPDAPRLHVSEPQPGFIQWPGNGIAPILITGQSPLGTSTIYYTVHDKGIVMDQGAITPEPGGEYALVYDATALHDDFPMLSLVAHEGRWEGLADEVSIHLLAVGTDTPRAASVTLIGEQVFVISGDVPGPYFRTFLPATERD